MRNVALAGLLAACNVPVTTFTPRPSCVGVSARCGTEGKWCCDTQLVPGGEFARGYDAAPDALNDFSYGALVSDFRLDTYEVTVGRFRQFVNAGMGTKLSPPDVNAGARELNGLADQGGWVQGFTNGLYDSTDALVADIKCGTTATWTDEPGGNEARPMNCLTWNIAFAFCVWDGGFLPTDSEWNYAATAGMEQRAYPWSEPPSSLYIDCSVVSSGHCAEPMIDNVGSKSQLGDGKWGHADLSGNLNEWTLDYMGPYINPCEDCADLTNDALMGRVFRGGSATELGAPLRTGFRRGQAANLTSPTIGVRCATPAR